MKGVARASFIKLAAILSCFVAGSLLVGTAVAGKDIKPLQAGENYSREGRVNSVPSSQKGTGGPGRGTVINLLGDVLLASGVGQAIASHGPDYPWGDTAGTLREADLTIANLECAVSDMGDPEADKEFTFRAAPRSLAGAVKAGVDVFTLANNHVLDFGRLAMLDTIKNLKESKISYTGAGLNEEDAVRPAILEAEGKRVAVLAFTRIIPRSGWIAGEDQPGLASGHNFKLMMDSVKAAESHADITVVGMHWGNEYEDFPEEKEIHLARALVDAGADIVVGHHPHVLQGVEIYSGKIIAYSLGNFIFTNSSSPKGREGAILQVIAGSNGEYSARIIPTYINNGTTRILKGDERKNALERLNLLCEPFKTSVDAKGEVRRTL